MIENQLIVLSQKPIIEYSMMEARGLEVAAKIAEMNLDTIEPTEENRSVMKKMRAELNNELGVFESQRKIIHEAITKPYKDFTKSYAENIKDLYQGATAQLKSKIGLVETKMLDEKNADINAYFNDVCDLDFLTIDSVSLNIILSASNKKLRTQIDVFVEKINTDLKAIQGMDNSVRIESLYKQNLDLSLSVSTVNADIKREVELNEQKIKAAEELRIRRAKRAEQARIKAEQDAKDRVQRKKKDAERLEEQSVIAEKNAKINKTKEAEDEVNRLAAAKIRAEEDVVIAEKEKQRIETEKEDLEKKAMAENKIHKMSFTVTGNISQLKQIKNFLNEIGASYE